MTQPFPLHWPPDWPRTPWDRRSYSRFRSLNLGRCRDDLLLELERLGAMRIVVSTDIPLRRDGIFYANAGRPDDPGVAVYFRWRGKPFAGTDNRPPQRTRRPRDRSRRRCR